MLFQLDSSWQAYQWWYALPCQAYLFWMKFVPDTVHSSNENLHTRIVPCSSWGRAPTLVSISEKHWRFHRRQSPRWTRWCQSAWLGGYISYCTHKDPYHSVSNELMWYYCMISCISGSGKHRRTIFYQNPSPLSRPILWRLSRHSLPGRSAHLKATLIIL